MIRQPQRSTLSLHDALPILRSFASDIGINMHTVNKAYQQLKQEGFLLIHRQKGVVVNPEPPKLDDQYEEKLLRSEEHTSELQSRPHLVCRLLLEKKKKNM